jgi:hypothetical protein
VVGYSAPFIRGEIFMKQPFRNHFATISQPFRNHFAVSLLTVTLMATGCNQQNTQTPVVSTPDSVIRASEPSIKVNVESSFRFNEPVEVKVAVTSPSAGLVDVQVIAPDAMGLPRFQQVSFQQPGTQIVTLQGKLAVPGYSFVTATAMAKDWKHDIADQQAFVVALGAQIGISSASAKSGTTTEEDFYKTIKVLKTAQEYDRYMDTIWRAEIDKKPIADRFVFLDGVKFRDKDDKDTAPVWKAQAYLPGTGSGKPSPEALEGKPKKGAVQAQGWGCQANIPSSVTVKMNVPENTTGNAPIIAAPLRRARITVYDENPWLPSGVIASGYTDDTGKFNFMKPNCDFGAAWDYSGPDVYFEVESYSDDQLDVQKVYFPGLQFATSVRSGTYWDTTATAFELSFNYNDSLWTGNFAVYHRARIGREFNTTAGGTNNQVMPLRIIVNSPLAIYSTFSPISKIELSGGQNFSSSPLYHEMGHEMLYWMHNKNQYVNIYNVPLGIIVPDFSFSHDCHNDTNGCSQDHMYNDGFADFYDSMVNGGPYGTTNYGKPSSPTLPVDFTSKYICSLASLKTKNHEDRVSEFLYRFAGIVLAPSAPSTAKFGDAFSIPLSEMKAQFARIRDAMWFSEGISLNVSFKNVWDYRLKALVPSDKTRIANELAAASCLSGVSAP